MVRAHACTHTRMHTHAHTPLHTRTHTPLPPSSQHERVELKDSREDCQKSAISPLKFILQVAQIISGPEFIHPIVKHIFYDFKFYFKNIFIGVQLVYRVVLVSGVHKVFQLYMYSLFSRLFSHGLSQNIEQSSFCYIQ